MKYIALVLLAFLLGVPAASAQPPTVKLSDVLAVANGGAAESNAIRFIQHGSERPTGDGPVIEVGSMVDNFGTAYELTYLVTGAPSGSAEPVTMRLVNDTAQAYGAQFEQVFVGGLPFLEDQAISMLAGEALEVQLSDVSSAVIAAGNGHLFVTFYPID